MSKRQQEKSEETRRRVLQAACEAVETGGLDAVNIRTIAKDAGYSIGSVYKHFADVDQLIVAVNHLTLIRIRDAMTETSEAYADPLERLKALAQTYYRFARGNTNLWLALFGHHLPDDQPAPEGHKDENAALLTLIGIALKTLHPELEGAELEARVRTCFAAVHGIVALALENRFVSLSDEVLEKELDFAVSKLVAK
ncbi:TetR family transcriptional regulator [Roseibium sp. TrichSKD4]|uniref:TetR/AcrR family transcriptional regulator n=1 Tax=Roseibium sp. TrichSKD4 TaxID=744980 RepID=UPI0001E564A3|nr:TetR/AcrR family transcriptional regulator [Roseibium sp. TrichSKD4]EFO34169.1 TetR family transcriptional regulator [Roseibium sp. TrichSKD4]